MTFAKWKTLAIGKYVVTLGVGITTTNYTVGFQLPFRDDFTIRVGPLWVMLGMFRAESHEDAKHICDLKDWE